MIAREVHMTALEVHRNPEVVRRMVLAADHKMARVVDHTMARAGDHKMAPAVGHTTVQVGDHRTVQEAHMNPLVQVVGHRNPLAVRHMNQLGQVEHNMS